MAAAVVRALRFHDIDVLTTREAGMANRPDADQLAFASDTKRVLYTANARDFVVLSAIYRKDGHQHSGIVLRVPQNMSATAQVRALSRLAEGSATGDFDNAVVYLKRWL